MNIEYASYDLANNEKETKDDLLLALKFKPSVISVFPFYVKSAKSILTNTDNTKLSVVIDYPFGLSDSEARIKSVEQAIIAGTNIVELIISLPLLCNRKYDKLKKELYTVSQLCQYSDVELRAILEYKLFAPDLLYKASYFLQEFGIQTIYPSANFLMDNISDNILAAMLILQKNPKIQVIANGSAWTNEHISLILSNTKIYGYKTSNIYTLEKICQKNL